MLIICSSHWMVDGSRADILTLQKRLTQPSSPQCDVVDFFWLRLGKLTAAGLAQAGPKPSVEDDPARHHERESLGESQRLFNALLFNVRGHSVLLMLCAPCIHRSRLGNLYPFVSCQMHLPSSLGLACSVRRSQVLEHGKPCYYAVAFMFASLLKHLA